jgi:hypothetical protein
MRRTEGFLLWTAVTPTASWAKIRLMFERRPAFPVFLATPGFRVGRPICVGNGFRSSLLENGGSVEKHDVEHGSHVSCQLPAPTGLPLLGATAALLDRFRNPCARLVPADGNGDVFRFFMN